MGLISRAQNDWRRFSSDADGFGIEITITKPDDSASITLNGLGTKHHIGYDSDGNLVNTKNAHISFSEQILIENEFEIRVNDEVRLYDYKISFADSTGVVKNYVVREWFPDETTGMIVCILGDYDGDN